MGNAGELRLGGAQLEILRLLLEGVDSQLEIARRRGTTLNAARHAADRLIERGLVERDGRAPTATVTTRRYALAEEDVARTLVEHDGRPEALARSLVDARSDLEDARDAASGRSPADRTRRFPDGHPSELREYLPAVRAGRQALRDRARARRARLEPEGARTDAELARRLRALAEELDDR